MSLTVNGVEINDPAIDGEVQYHPAPSLERARREAARALVVRELLLQRARALGIDQPDPPGDGDEDAETETPDEGRIRTLLAREVALPEPDSETCQRYYRNNAARFRSADLFEAAHILLAAAPDDAPARAVAEDLAKRLLAEITAEPARFEALAKAHSACPSAANGGRLGQVARGDTVPEFETFLCNLDEGQICPVPVKTRFGFHLLRLDRRLPGRQLPFELVEERIADYLRDSAWRRAVSQYVKILAAQAEIAGPEAADLDLPAATSPLVQ